MTQVTPPGWYPDPGQTTDGPRSERWWDGGVWTDQTRKAGAAPGWGPPAYPPGTPGPPPGRRRGLRTAVAAGVAVVVLACIGGGVYVLTSDDDGHDTDRAAPSHSPGVSGPDDGDGGHRAPRDHGSPTDPSAPSLPKTEDGYATDLASGISLPVPEGWEGQSGQASAGVTTGEYQCPGDTSQSCVLGGVFSAPARLLKLTQSTAEAAAKADIAKNAEDSYGGEVYGAITSHRELASEAVDVAGGRGYLVRWKVVTDKGDDGYVESLVFPSPVNENMLVAVRFGFDVNDKAPKLSVMDEITKGIKKAVGGAGNGKRV